MDTSEIARRIDVQTSRWGSMVVRYLAALLWLGNVVWKVPPAFGDSGGGSCDGLCGYARDGIENPVFPGSAWLFDHLIVPNIRPFGWLTLLVEVGLAATLLSGRYLRVAGAVGVIQSLAIMASVANTDGEWYWTYLLMIAVNLAVVVLAPQMTDISGRVMAVIGGIYAVMVGISHSGAGLTGTDWTLFTGDKPFPNDLGRNLFPGSMALGLVVLAVAVAVWFLAALDAPQRMWIGWGLLAIAGVLLFTDRDAGLIIGLGSKSPTVAILAAFGLSLIPTRAHQRSHVREDAATVPPGVLS